MPIPPYHFGPGLAFKALGGQRFSFMVFGGAQFLIDLEPGVRMVIGTQLIHGLTHTLGGAVVIGTVATIIGKPISEFVLRLLRVEARPLTWAASAAGAYSATLSHILLDGPLHADMRPWFPLTDASGILGLVSRDTIHLICWTTGAIGCVGLLAARTRLRSPFPVRQSDPSE